MPGAATLSLLRKQRCRLSADADYFLISPVTDAVGRRQTKRASCNWFDELFV